MDEYSRYALYFTPRTALARFGAAWLGWDIATGQPVDDPDLNDRLPQLRGLTKAPRKYGFHATLKAPFRLANGSGLDDLRGAVADFAAQTSAIRGGALRPQMLGSFLALCPSGDESAINRLAFEIVQRFDRFRAPLSGAELEYRRAGGLTPEQDVLLTQWGYPYVEQQFRLHLTLTGPLEPGEDVSLRQVLETAIPPLCPDPFVLDRLVLVGERRADGYFRALAAHDLAG